MKIKFYNIVSLFVLLIFVYPYIQKEIHTFEHAHDFHCTTHTEQHFHSEIHHCLVCEYNILLGETNKEFSLISKTETFFVKISSFYKKLSINAHAYSYLLRGPPLF